MAFLDVKGISYLANHTQILFKSSWRLCLSRLEITKFPIFVSSANFPIKLFNPMSMSFMYIMNSTGPRTEPYGTPLVTGAQSEAVPLITTLCFSIAEPVFYPAVHITGDSQLFDLKH